MKCLTIQINKRNKALSQFKNYNFNSLVNFKGQVLGTNPGGLFKLGAGNTTDAGSTIEWRFTPVETDFGLETKKHIRYIYYRVNTAQSFDLEVTPDNQDSETYTIDIPDAGLQRVRQVCRSDHYGETLKFEFSGTGDFDMESIKLLLVALHYGHE